MMKPPLHTFITKQATLDGKRFRSTWPVFDFSWVPLIRQGRRPCHLPRRGRLPPAGEEDGGSAYIRTGSAREVAPLIRPGLRPVHLPRGGRLPPGGGGGAVPGQTLHRPTPVPGFARSTLSQERAFISPIIPENPPKVKRGLSGDFSQGRWYAYS